MAGKPILMPIPEQTATNNLKAGDHVLARGYIWEVVTTLGGDGDALLVDFSRCDDRRQAWSEYFCPLRPHWTISFRTASVLLGGRYERGCC